MHATEFIQQKKSEKNSIYLLYGEEAFYIQKAREKIVSLHESDTYDYEVYDMETTPVQEAILDAETFPFFHENKIVVLNRALFLTGQNQQTEFEHDISALLDYATHPAEFTTLIIVVPFSSLDRRKKVTQVIQKSSTVIDCSAPKAYEMTRVLDGMLKNYNLDVTDEIKGLLIERVGEQIEALDQELEKLSLYATQGELTYAQAEQLISPHAETSAFTITDAIVERNLERALSSIIEFRKRQEEPIGLLALVASQLRMFLQCKLYKKLNYTESQITKNIKAHPYAIKMALKKERTFSEAELKTMLIHAADCDEQMKTGRMDKWLALEVFLEKSIQLSKNAM